MENSSSDPQILSISMLWKAVHTACIVAIAQQVPLPANHEPAVPAVRCGAERVEQMTRHHRASWRRSSQQASFWLTKLIWRRGLGVDDRLSSLGYATASPSAD